MLIVGARPSFEQSPAAFVQSLAIAVLNHASNQLLHGLNSHPLCVQLLELLFRQPAPSLRRRRALLEAEKQGADLIQAKPCFPCSLNHSNFREDAVIVTPLPAHPARGHQDADLLVVSNCRRAESKLLCDFRDGHFLFHPRIVT